MEIERVKRSCSLLVDKGLLAREQVTTLLLAWKRRARTQTTTTSLPEVLVELGLVAPERLDDVRAVCSLVSQAPDGARVYSLEPGSVRAPEGFRRYDIVEELSRGGMGVVYRARHKALEKEVALKVLQEGLGAKSAPARFRQEARVLARLSHPNIVSVSDLGEEDGWLYYVMELVPGLNLEDTYLKEGRLGVEWSVGIVREVAQALEFCHESGLIHRDVKPTNVIVEREKGLPILVDFGLVRCGQEEVDEVVLAGPPIPPHELVRPAVDGDLGEAPDRSFLTAAGHVVGTPGFMAPEQVSPELGEVGPRSDVYSLGATLYYLLTGRAPFQGPTLIKVLTAVLRDEPPAIRSLNPEVPEAVAKVCHLALSKSPGDRPTSAAVFAEALARALAAQEAAPVGPGAVQEAPEDARRGEVVRRGALKIAWAAASVPQDPPSEALAKGAIAATEPDGFRTLLRRGNRRFKKGDPEGAVELLTRAIDAYDRSPQAFSNRGVVYYSQKDYARAIADFDAALDLDPDHVAAYRRRGRAHFKNRDFAAAVRDFSEVIRLCPDDPDAYHKRGVAHYRLGEEVKAVADEDRARLLAWGPVSGVDEEPSEELSAVPQSAQAPPRPVTVLTLEGPLDHSTGESLEEVLQRLLLEGHTRILVDGAGLSHVSSRSASLFLGLLRPLRLAGGDLKFCRLNDKARALFTTLGLGELLELEFADVDSALRAFERPLPEAWLDALREGWVGLVTSEEFHRPTCERVKATDPAFQVWFGSEDEAVLAGRSGCPRCCR